MSDPRNTLQKLFEEANRYANFGDVLTQMHVQGFRCHSNTILHIASPITAFCGLNGTGKSTLLQLAAAAYQSPGAYYIKDFMVVSSLDPNPFTHTATVEYKFWQSDRSLKPLTLSRNAVTKRWQGYPRRPKRLVLFAGIGLYLPKIEQRDFIVRNASRLSVSSSSAVSDHTREWTSKVLGYSYENIFSNTVSYSRQTGKIVSVQRSGIAYSEAHMGYGEGRSHYLISLLEAAPNKTLVLIEEPETSLHPSAQHEFGKYLVDVAIRKKHQIFVTTHSEFILQALPSLARTYLKSASNGVDIITGLTPLQARSLMAQGRVKALHILVEDECAKAVLSEILRKTDRDFLQSTGIHCVGDANTIAKTVRALQVTGLPVVAVRDADQGPQPSENIFSLPGSRPPEKDIFQSTAVKNFIRQRYGVNLDDFSTSLTAVDHHRWCDRLADHVAQDRAALVGELACVYVQSLPETETANLVVLLKAAAQK